MLTVLFLGDIVGEPGRQAVIDRLPELKEKYTLDFVVANGENAAAGRGITSKLTIDLLRAGVSVVTSGDHIWDQKDILGFLNLEPRLLRPIELSQGRTRRGYDRPRDGERESRRDQCAGEDVYAANPGEPISRRSEVPLPKCGSKPIGSLLMFMVKRRAKKSPWVVS